MAASSDTMKQNCLFVGNPGAGKSTLLNCIMLAKDPTLEKEKMFKSGVSIVKGMTYQFDQRAVKDIVFMDTPGLEDVKLREQAAKAISEALKQSGFYKVVFVVTLEAGRIRPQDVTVIKLVLESAKEITQYGVIFNKLTKVVMKLIDESDENKCALVTQASLKTDDSKVRPLPFPLFLRKIDDLEDMDDTTAEIPELEEFLGMIRFIEIHKENVDDIKFDKFEKMREALEEQLKALKESNELMEKKMEQDKKEFEERMKEDRRQHEDMLKENQRQYDEKIQRMKSDREDDMKTFQEQCKKNTGNEEVLKRMEVDSKQRSEEWGATMAQEKRNHEEKMKKMTNQHEIQMEHIKSKKCCIS